VEILRRQAKKSSTGVLITSRPAKGVEASTRPVVENQAFFKEIPKELLSEVIIL